MFSVSSLISKIYPETKSNKLIFPFEVCTKIFIGRMEFEKILQQATDSICLNPKLDLFLKLGQIVNSRPSM